MMYGLYIYPVIVNLCLSIQKVLFKVTGEKHVLCLVMVLQIFQVVVLSIACIPFVYDKFVLYTELVNERETKLKSTNMEKEACVREQFTCCCTLGYLAFVQMFILK